MKKQNYAEPVLPRGSSERKVASDRPHMTVTVRLQPPWDMDLIALASEKEFPFSKWLKAALIAWATGDTSFVIPCPKPTLNRDWGEWARLIQEEARSNGQKNPLNMAYSIHFRESEKDYQTKEKLCQIRYGWQNAFIKTLFRHYMDKPYMTVFGPESLFEHLSWLNGEKIVPSMVRVPTNTNTVRQKEFVSTAPAKEKQEFMSEKQLENQQEEQKKQEVTIEKPEIGRKTEETEETEDLEDTGFDLFAAAKKAMGDD